MYERWKDPEAVEWAKKIKDRDNFTCQICRKYGVPLNSHHLNSWDFFIDQRYILANGVTLCEGCHERFHNIYGRGRNTTFQYLQFKKSVETFRRALQKII